MKRFLGLGILLILLMQGCGGPKLANFKDASFIGAAGIGDLINVDISGANLTATFPEGKLKGKKVTATMEHASGFDDYVYGLKEYPGSRVIVVPDRILFYASGELGKFGVTVPNRKKAYKPADIEGEYNYVSLNILGIIPVISHGTFEIKNNNWSSWDQKDKSGAPTYSGTVIDKADGTLEATLTKTGLSFFEIAGLGIKLNEKFANVMFGADGTMVLDLDQLNGFAIGAKQQSTSADTARGKYIALTTADDEAIYATIDGQALSYNVGSVSVNRTLNFNAPWKGFISDNTMFGLLPKDLYFAVDTKGFVLIAIKQ